MHNAPGQPQDPAQTEDQVLDQVREGPSKSQLKREKQALQSLAERVAGMPRAELERLHLSEATWAAIDETRRIKDLRARRRHFKRIANLLEREDMHAVRALIDETEARERAAAARHHSLERWRERLLTDGDAALAALIDHHPEADRQQVRSLVRAARRDNARGRPEAPRKLFRLLRELMDQQDAHRSE